MRSRMTGADAHAHPSKIICATGRAIASQNERLACEAKEEAGGDPVGKAFLGATTLPIEPIRARSGGGDHAVDTTSVIRQG